MATDEIPQAAVSRKQRRRCLAWLTVAAWLCFFLAWNPLPAPARAFDFQKDTFSFANELTWDYHYDSNGHWTSHKRSPKPDYTLHCFVLARSARQFFDHARFDPNQPVADEKTYRRLIRRVVWISPRKRLPELQKIVIPGYADLRSFSAAHEKLLKAQCGSAWQSYFQRGNWRMIFPFSRAKQARMALQILSHLRPDHPVIVHLLRFPQLSINHAVVLYAARETKREIQFTTYDPNNPESPITLTFDRATRMFVLPATNYFPGGALKAYEVYWKWDY